MPNDQLDELLNRLVSGTGEITGTELEQLRSAIFGAPESEKPSEVADIAAELDARGESDQGEDVSCELQSAEDYLARVAAEDQPVPASLLRLVGAAPALRTTSHVAEHRPGLAGLRRQPFLAWGSAIAATVLAGISGYFVHDFVHRYAPAPANFAAIPRDLANGRPSQSANSAVANAGPVQRLAPVQSTPAPVPTLAVTPPTPITSHAVSDSDYPPESVRQQEQGTVKVKYLVLNDGSVDQCQVQTSSGYPGLDDAACMLVKSWRFRPASLSDGTAVEWWLNTAVVFRLAGRAANSHPSQATQMPIPPVAITSHAVTADDYPPVSVRLQEQGNVGIKYLVKEDGTVGDCSVTISSGKARLDDAACTMAIKRWKFKPATQNGRAVAEYLTAEVIFQLK